MINLKNKQVILRVDYNVPLKEKNNKWQVLDDNRIKATLPTIKYLLKNNCKIVLISYLGRPEGKINEKMRLQPIGERLAKLLNYELRIMNYELRNTNYKLSKLFYFKDCLDPRIKNFIFQAKPKSIFLLENTRFYPQEDKNNLSFAKKLAQYGEIFINDAFGQSHRKCASIVGISKYLPTYSGLLMEKEIKILSQIMKKPKKPLVIIIGGAKIEDKIPVIENFLDQADKILIGGKIANILLSSKSMKTKHSLISPKILKSIQNNLIYLPIDGLIGKINNSKIKPKIISITNYKLQITGYGLRILDIGPKTIKLYQKIISQSKTIIWTGPMGLFEDKRFSQGTKKIAEAILKSSAKNRSTQLSRDEKAQILIGGGDTEASLSLLPRKLSHTRTGQAKNNLHISTGGGAMLEFLAGKKLPGIENLTKSK